MVSWQGRERWRHAVVRRRRVDERGGELCEIGQRRRGVRVRGCVVCVGAAY